MLLNVVVSHANKYLYYSIPKTATTSIKIYLESYSLVDIGLHSKQDGYTVAYDESWNSYFKFTFVRNPWDRILSCFLDKTKQSIGKSWEMETYKPYADCSFEEFIDYLTQDNILYDAHTTPQHLLINLSQIDFIGKFEYLDKDFNTVQNRLRLPLIKLSRENITHHDHYRYYYNKQTKNKIYQLYKDDIEKFQYEF
jgi:hypothetical protein